MKRAGSRLEACLSGLRDVRRPIHPQARKLGYRGSLKNCVFQMKEMRKFLEVDLDAAKKYLVEFSKLDSTKRGLLSYQDFIKAFDSKDTEELR